MSSQLVYHAIRHYSRSSGGMKRASGNVYALYGYMIGAGTLPFVAPILRRNAASEENSTISLHHCCR